MATHSSVLAWRIPQRSLEGSMPMGLQSSQTKPSLHTHTHTHTLTHTHDLNEKYSTHRKFPPSPNLYKKKMKTTLKLNKIFSQTL